MNGSTKRTYLPLSAYHWRRSRNALMSASILSETPDSSTTLWSGRFRLGCPNGFHSIPHAVWITSFPSLPRIARSLASVSRWGKRERSRLNAVSVTVSQGTPDMSCIDLVSRSRFICQLDVNCVDRHMVPKGSHLHPSAAIFKIVGTRPCNQVKDSRGTAIFPLLYYSFDTELMASNPWHANILLGVLILMWHPS